MGIRFLCPNGHKLNVKDELAGKRGLCPDCGAKFVIPAASTAPLSGIVSHPEIAAPVETPAGPATWYLRPISGGEYGPVSAAVFADWIAEGRVTTDAQVWCEGWPDWRTALNAAELLPTRESAVAVAVLPDTVAPVALDSSIPESITFVAPAIEPASDTADAIASPEAARRVQIRQLQFALAIVMFLVVIILAGVLIWVLNRNPTEIVTPEPPAAAVSWLAVSESGQT